ncbi:MULTISPECIES: hypothetical protein [Staphylococcus]|nr:MULTISPECIES: hypothetical protein [Staphylococcus]MDS3883578.1 hypothetical protein [Staphylococcus hominis]MDU3541031.1 hypothetical protein [Staphylococcus sp.]
MRVIKKTINTDPYHLIPISKYKDFDYKNCSLDTTLEKLEAYYT